MSFLLLTLNIFQTGAVLQGTVMNRNNIANCMIISVSFSFVGFTNYLAMILHICQGLF